MNDERGYFQVATSFGDGWGKRRISSDDKQTLDELISARGPTTAVARTLQTYESMASAETGGEDGPHMLTALYFDFDSADDVEHARKDAVRFLETHMKHNSDLRGVRIAFSGSKGFGISFAPELFGMKCDVRNTLANKAMAQDAKERLKLGTLDLAIYSMRRLIRCENTRHQKSGLFKIPLTFDELCSKDMGQIRELAKSPRPHLAPDDGVQEVPAFATTWEGYLEAAGAVQTFRVKGVPADERALRTGREKKGELSPGIQSYLKIGGTNASGSRNNTRFGIALCAIGAGYGEAEVLDLLTRYNARCKPVDDVPKIRAQLDQVYAQLARGDYSLEPSEKKVGEKIMLTSARELATMDFPPREWVAEPLIPRVCVAFFSGKRSCHKTWAALDLALSVAAGSPFLGHFTTHRAPVLFLDAENGQRTLKERLNLLGREIPEGVDFACFPTLKLDQGDGRTWLENYLGEHEGAVVFLDTFRRLVSGDENDAKEVSDSIMALRALAERYAATFILLHHLRKGFGQKNASDDLADEMRGSSELGNIADSILVFERRRATSGVVMRHQKSRVGVEHEPCLLSIDRGEDGERFCLQYAGTWAELETQPDKAGKEVLKWAQEQQLKGQREFQTKDAQEALKVLGLSPKAVSRGLGQLVADGKLQKPAKGRFMLPSKLPDFGVES